MTSILYIGMDVHSTSYTLCSYELGDENGKNFQSVEPDYKQVLKYMERIRAQKEDEVEFVCGYEAGCLGYTLYRQMTSSNVKCIILAPSTMAVSTDSKKKKTDRRDAERIAKCLAYHTYSAVHIPTEGDLQVRDHIRMRNDHKLAIKKLKQEIIAFCLSHGYRYEMKSNWTQRHLAWLHELKLPWIDRETLNEYLLTYTGMVEKVERMDRRIEELAQGTEYRDMVQRLVCFMGVKTHTALSVIVEVGDFKRFPSAGKFSAFLGLVPCERSSGDRQNLYGITKAGNSHLRKLLVEAAQSYSRGKIGHKSQALKARQACASPEVVEYANRANEHLRRKYYRMVLSNGKKTNVAKTAIARELSGFMWGMMTDNIL